MVPFNDTDKKNIPELWEAHNKEEVNLANLTLESLRRLSRTYALKSIDARYGQDFGTLAPSKSGFEFFQYNGSALPIFSFTSNQDGSSFDAIILGDGNIHRLSVDEELMEIDFHSFPDKSGKSSLLVKDIESPPQTIIFNLPRNVNLLPNKPEEYDLKLIPIDENLHHKLDFQLQKLGISKSSKLWNFKLLTDDQVDKVAKRKTTISEIEKSLRPSFLL